MRGRTGLRRDGVEVFAAISGAKGDDYTGTGGADNYEGTRSADTARLLGGNDRADGAGGDDVIDGGGGNDSLNGGLGDDVLTGGLGIDILNGGRGIDRLDGGEAGDTIIVSGDADVVDGGEGVDTLLLDTTFRRYVVDLDARGIPVDGTFLLAGQIGQGIERVEVASDAILGDGDDRLLFGALWRIGLKLDAGGGNDVIEGGTLANIISGGAGDDVLTGQTGSDELRGELGNDTLTGGGGVDNLNGGFGDDVLFGGDGNDSVSTDRGTDRVDAGLGLDTVYASFFGVGDVLDGGEGRDTVFLSGDGGAFFLDLTGLAGDGTVLVRGGTATIRNFEVINIAFTQFGDTVVYGPGQFAPVTLDGLAGDDRLVGGAGRDTLTGGDGNDVLDGGGGADVMSGGFGDDSYYLSTTADTVSDAGGIDTVYAAFSFTLSGGAENGTLTGAADATLKGTQAANLLIGNAGANVITGDAGSDRIDGGAGDDTVSYAEAAGVVVDLSVERQATGRDGYGATDTLISIENAIGSLGADTLRGSAGANRLTGGGGDDLLDGRGGDDLLDGGTGFDTASFASLAEGVRVDLIAGRAYSGTATDELRGIEAVIGTAFGDVIVNDGVRRTLDGGAGDDQITGGSAVDSIIGGLGNDVLDGGLSNDTVSGGLGNDTVNGGAGTDLLDGGYGADRIDGGTGYDTLTFAAFAGSVNVDLKAGRATYGSQVDTVVGIEAVIGTAFADTLACADVAGRLDGGDGDDLMFGGNGDDIFFGGDGTDIASYERATGAVTIDLSTDRASGSAGADVLVDIEHAIGSRFNDTLVAGLPFGTLDGGPGDDLLMSAPDTLVIGGEGFDTVDFSRFYSVTVDLNSINPQDTGGAGINVLFEVEGVIGGAWEDRLIGNGVANTLAGGGRDDVLTGGGGADRFVMDTTSGTDTITDFAAGVDQIAFEGAVTGLPIGPLAAGMFRLGVAAQDADDRVMYDQNTGKIYFDADGVGGNVAVGVAVLTTGPTLSAADFVVI